MFGHFRYFPRYTVDPFHVPVISGFFRIFPLFSASVYASHSCSLSCSCHFRLLPLRPSHLTIVPLDGPVMAAIVRTFPRVSASRFRLRQGRLTIDPFMFLSFPDFSELFRFGPAISQLFFFMFVSFPDFAGCFRRCRICPAVTKLLPSCSCHFRMFPPFPASAQLSNNCCHSCSCHFRTCPDVLAFSGFVPP